MADSNVIFQNLFAGVGYPTFDPWPDFSYPSGNPSGWSHPVVDGRDHGIASRDLRSVSTMPWRAKSDFYPGRENYKVDLDVRWADPANGYDTVGLIVRYLDYDNLITARVQCGGTPSVKLYRVIGGVATQLGATYTGTGFSTANLLAGLKFRVRVEDLLDGDTRITVYRNPTDDDNGTSVIDVTTDTVGDLRGLYTAGIELSQVLGDSVYVSSLTCRDFADEWTPGGGTVGTGWQVELGDVLYDMSDLAVLSPKIALLRVKQAYGQTGNECQLEIRGDYKLQTGSSAVLYPGQSCRVFHDGDCRFWGTISEADSGASAKSEIQTFRGRDSLWASRQVILQADDKTGGHYFNVYAPHAAETTGGNGACGATTGADVPDEYDPDLQNMTIGAIIKWLFDRYSDGDERLRFYGAIPSSGTAYVQAELNLLDAVIPDLHLSGTFYNAIASLLKYMPKFQVFCDPATKKWHFVDVTSTSATTITMPADCVPMLKIKPDRDKSYTAIVWRGAKRQNGDPVTLELADGSLTPAWTDEQEANHSDKKKHKTFVSITIASSGSETNVTYKGKFYLELQYLQISANDAVQLDVDPDDWRGSVVGVNGIQRFVIGNTATKFYLSVPNWGMGEAPIPGTAFVITYEDECAQEALSAMGVGQGFILFRPGVICGIPDKNQILPYFAGLKNKGFCGQANVAVKGFGPDTNNYVQAYDYRVKTLTEQAQTAFGICNPLMLLSKPIVKPMALVNFFGPGGSYNGGAMPPGESPPLTECQKGYKQVQPQVNVSVELSSVLDDAAYQRYPTTGYRGTAYSDDETTWDGGGAPLPGDWKSRNVLVIDDPEFRDLDIQGPGILKAQQAIIALFGQKAYTVEAELVTPWHGLPVLARTARFASLQTGLRLASTARTTGFEDADLPLYEVEWDIEKSVTRLKAGTPVAWIGIDPKALASSFVDKHLLQKVYNKMKELEDFRNALIAHKSSVVGGGTPFTPGCQVSVIDNRQFTDIQQLMPKKDKKIGALAADAALKDVLLGLRPADNPGSPVSMPGSLTGAASKMPVRSAAVLESLANPRFLAEQGPSGTARVNGDRSRYGGLIGTDDQASGGPASEIVRYSNYAFRRAPDKSGDVHGGASLQYALLDSNGAPTGWVALSPTSFPDAHVPLSIIGPNGLLDTLLSRIKASERTLNATVDATTEKTLTPGDITATYPDGVPADLVTVALAMTQFLASKLLASTLKDPGGAVFTGCKTEDGLDSQTFWRVAMPERVVYQVENVGFGSGENGGAWSAVLVDSQPTYAESMSIYHKQIHASELDADRSSDTVACPTDAEDDSPYGFANARGRNLDSAAVSGLGAIVPLPRGSIGIPLLEAGISEVASEAAGAGLHHVLWFDFSYKASAWSAQAQTATKTALTTDGTGEGVGSYKAPGGAVPPGLRPPSDAPALLGLAIRRDPAADSANGFSTTVIGIGVSVAVVDGGIWLRIRDQGIAIVDVLVHNHPQKIEACAEEETWSLAVTKNETESATCSDSVAVQLNPPVHLDEVVDGDDDYALTTTKNLTEAAHAHDVVVTQLNPP